MLPVPLEFKRVLFKLASASALAPNHAEDEGRRPKSETRSSKQMAKCPSTTLVSSPLYSMPHFSLTMTIWPVSSFRNGFGLTGTAAWGEVCWFEEQREGESW